MPEIFGAITAFGILYDSVAVDEAEVSGLEELLFIVAAIFVEQTLQVDALIVSLWVCYGEVNVWKFSIDEACTEPPPFNVGCPIMLSNGS